MKTGVVGFASFVIGGVLGYLTANKLLKDRYEQLVQEEVDSVKAAFKKEHPTPKKELPKQVEKERRDYAKRVSDLGYSETKNSEPKIAPRVIPPETYGDQDGYDEISLTYYADGTVTDDNDRAMGEDEIEETIGKESLTHFGEYEDDSVFVRNDRLKADYEILMDQRTYEDILKEKPYLLHT